MCKIHVQGSNNYNLFTSFCGTFNPHHIHCFPLWITNELEVFNTQLVVFLASSCPKLLAKHKKHVMVQANCMRYFPQGRLLSKVALLPPRKVHLLSSSYQVLHVARWLSHSASFCIHQTPCP